MNTLRFCPRAIALALVMTTGCANLPSAQPAQASRYLKDPAFASLPVLAANTQVERDYATRQSQNDASPTEQDKRERKLYRSGLIVGGIGSAFALGFGIAGAINNRNLENGYDDGLSRERYNELKDRGKINNRLTWISAGIGLLGWATATIVYGESFRHCSALASRNRACREREVKIPAAAVTAPHAAPAPAPAPVPTPTPVPQTPEG